MAEEANPDELAQVLGLLKEEVIVGTKTIVITPFRTKQFVDVLKHVDRMVEAGEVEIKLPAGVGLDDALADIKRQFDPVKMVLRGGDQLIRILTISTGLSVSHIEGLGLTDTVRLTAATFKVNLDFFVQEGPTLREALGPVWETIVAAFGEPAGSEQSPDSSTAATA